MNKYLSLFDDCKIVKGVRKSLIIDLSIGKLYYIPNSLEYIVNQFINKNYFDLINDFLLEEQLIINEYFEWLSSNGFIFWVDNKNEFKSFSNNFLSFDRPYRVENCILEISSKYDAINVFNQIIQINIPYLELRFYEPVSYKYVFNLIKRIKNSNIEGIDIIIKYLNDDEAEKYHEMIKSELRINNIIFTGSKKNENIEFFKGLSFISHKTENIHSSIHCGKINQKYYRVNKTLFFESLNHNSCLNKKLSIDKDGNIKNCPSMPQSFGNIKDTTLEEALNHPDFKKYWNVNKDMIAVCKDCEFRHICTDCRAYTERTHFDGEIDLSKPLKCGYNPYTNEWVEWSTNPLKEKAIEYYGMQELVKNDA